MKTGKVSKKFLIAAIAILVIALLAMWYFFLFKPTTEDTTSINRNITELDSSTQLLETQSSIINTKIAFMNTIINKDCKLLVYDKSTNTDLYMKFLNSLFTQTTSYDVAPQTPLREEDPFISRTYSISFTSSYVNARNIIKSIENGPYRCVITSIKISEEGTNDDTEDDPTSNVGPGFNGNVTVNTACTVVFFETLEGCNDETGLPEKKIEIETTADDEE